MMSVYRPDRRQPARLTLAFGGFRPFKLALLEQSLALFPMLPTRLSRRRRSNPLSRLSPGKQGQDLRVVLRGVDVIWPAKRRHSVEKLRVAIEDLPGTGIAFKGVELLPHLPREHHRGGPMSIRATPS